MNYPETMCIKENNTDEETPLRCDPADKSLEKEEIELGSSSVKETVLQMKSENTMPLDQSEHPEPPKILVQRKFQKSEKHTVEKKLDFIIADTETEISKHVFGGLFNTKYYPYIPENYCKKHAPNLFEYENEELPKIGDKFDSHDSFRLYVDGKAKEWKYYLKCADSHRKNGMETFVYKCVFARPRSTVSKAKGLRKRTRRVPLHDCPCRVLLKPVPSGAKDLTVIYVCNHHDHPLTDDYFYKLQHGRRLHPSVKEELMDLLSLDVDREIVKKYFESLTGYSMNYGYFANMLIYMKKNKIERKFTLEKLKEMSKKIDKIKEELGFTNEEENADDPGLDIEQIQSASQDVSSKIAEVFNVLHSVSAPKKTPSNRNRQRLDEEPGLNSVAKTTKSRKRKTEDFTEVPAENVNNKSRLETRLQQLNHDEKTLQNIKHLQDSVRTENNPWPNERNALEITQRNSQAKKSKRTKSPNININAYVNTVQDHNDEAVVETVVETSENIIETPQCDSDILYENEITVEDNTIENNLQYIIYENNDIQDLEANGNVRYCIQYEVNEESEVPNESYILLENLEHMPVQVQATELATVSITAEDIKDSTEDSSIGNDQLVLNTDTEEKTQQKVDNVIEVIEQPAEDGSLDIGNGEVYEVIETNNKKIFPSRDLVQTVILNKNNKSIEDKKIRRKYKLKLNKRKRDKHLFNSNKCFSKNKDYKRRKPKNTRQFDDDMYSSEDNVEFEKQQLFSQLAHYGVDLEQLKDDDHYVIVVEDTNEENENLDYKHSISGDEIDSKSGMTKLFNEDDTTVDELHRSKIEESLHHLKKVKQSLKTDIINLIATKNKLNDVTEDTVVKKENAA